jgi:hypothetical protein
MPTSSRSRCNALAAAAVSLAATCALAAQDDPAVYIDVADTRYFSPQAAFSTAGFAGHWYFRRTGLSQRKGFILNAAAGGIYPDLLISPNLRGRYNLYVGTREVDWLCGFQLKLSDRELAATVTPALATPQAHFNREMLWATDVEMNGQTILLHHLGRAVYFDYLKFMPVGADKPDARIDPERVRDEPLMDMKAAWRRDREAVPPGMREIKYSPGPSVSPANDTAGRGYVTYSRSYLDPIFPSSAPRAREVTSELSAFASRGEYEPVTFSVYAFRDLGPCTVKVGDLRNGASVLGKSDIAVAAVRCRNLRTTYYGNDYMRAPAMLDSAASADIPKGESRQFWLTVHVPLEARPGEYRGEVTFAPADAPPARLSLRFRVFPFALREPADLALGMYDLLWSIEAEAGFPRGRFEDMRAHGMTTVGYCGAANCPFVLDGGRAALKFDGAGGLEQGMDAHRDAKFPYPLVWLMGDDLWSWCGQQAEVGSPRFGDLYKQLIQSILAEAKKRRWPGVVFQPVDEPGSYEYRPIPGYAARWAAETELIHQAGGVTEADHIPLSTTDERLRPFLERALPSIDIFTERYSNKPIWFEKDGWSWSNLKDQVANWRKTLWSYNINDADFFPQLATMRFAFGHFLWLEGVRGQLLWAYQDAAGNPFNALDGKNTDLMYRFPALPEIGENGGPSLMWECIREGADDYKYLHALAALADEVRARGDARRADEARKVLDRLAASLDLAAMRGKCSYIECQWAERFALPSGETAVGGAFNIPNGWSFRDYDVWRLEIARQIARLSAPG